MDRDPPRNCTSYIIVPTIYNVLFYTSYHNARQSYYKFVKIYRVHTAIECHAETMDDGRKKLPPSPTVITSLLFSIADKTIERTRKKTLWSLLSVRSPFRLTQIFLA